MTIHLINSWISCIPWLIRLAQNCYKFNSCWKLSLFYSFFKVRKRGLYFKEKSNHPWLIFPCTSPNNHSNKTVKLKIFYIYWKVPSMIVIRPFFNISFRVSIGILCTMQICFSTSLITQLYMIFIQQVSKQSYLQ